MQIIFTTPDEREIMCRLCDDLAAKQSPLYKQAHLLLKGAKESRKRRGMTHIIGLGRAAWHNGTYVYWHRSNGDTVPARVTGVSKNGKRIQIEANCVEGTRVVTVSESKLSRQ